MSEKKPLYKKWWFWVLIVIVVIIILPSGNSNTGETNSGSKKVEMRQNITYTQYKAKDLFDELENNAMKAEQTHQNEYVEIEGYLSVIDSDGEYISIGANPNAYEYMFDSIHCSFTDDNQKNVVMNMSKDDKLIVKGQITEIGEILGYMLDIHSIEKAR